MIKKVRSMSAIMIKKSGNDDKICENLTDIMIKYVKNARNDDKM